ncbi:MAG: hypothetical protein HY735_22885 [Verrucomicrobia bacterium]|nr:hypothetical protein [Verrucomicrobiota bacterium]
MRLPTIPDPIFEFSAPKEFALPVFPSPWPSPQGEGSPASALGRSRIPGLFRAWQTFLPLPWGEGWGEGEGALDQLKQVLQRPTGSEALKLELRNWSQRAVIRSRRGEEADFDYGLRITDYRLENVRLVASAATNMGR